MQSSLSTKQLWLPLYLNFFVSVQKLLASDVRKFHLNSIANRLKMIDLEYFKNSTLRIHGLDKIEVNDSYPIKNWIEALLWLHWTKFDQEKSEK